ncbi:branched-chain amino acid ABC transporter substrate-binding protein [Dongia sp. agr-C8]
MNSRLLRNLSAILAMLLLAACAGGAKTASTSSTELVIGTAGPMEGPLAAFGEQMRRGTQAAVTDINAKGGVLGKQLRLVVADDRCQPPKAVPTANDLIDQGAVFVVGHFCSGTSIPAAKVYQDAGVLQITPSSSNTELTEQGIPTVFRVTNRDDAQGIFAGTWLAKAYAGKNLAVIDDEQPYGRDTAGQTAKTAEALGLKPAMMGSFKRGTKDFSDLITRLKAAKIDVVFVGGYHDEVGPFAKQAREQGFDGAFVSDDALNTNEFVTYAGSAADGVRFADASSKTGLAAAREVVAKFRNGDYPSRLDPRYEPEGYTLNAYAAVQVFAAAAAGTNSTDARKMAEWLKANHVQTVIGDLSWDAKGDLKELYYAWYAWQNGQYRQQPD